MRLFRRVKPKLLFLVILLSTAIAGAANVISSSSSGIPTSNGLGTNTAFYSTIGGGAVAGIGKWQIVDGTAFGVPGQSLLVFSGETNTFIIFSGANGGASIQWFRNHFNNNGVDPELVINSDGSIAIGPATSDFPGNYHNDRAFQIGVNKVGRGYSYQQREDVLWDAVNGHFGCFPIQFAPYYTNGDGTLYSVGIYPPTALGTQLPSLTCNASDIFGRGEFTFWDYFDNGTPTGTTWNLAGSRKRFLVRIGTNTDTGGITLYGRADITNMTTGTTQLWKYDGANSVFSVPIFSGRLTATNSGGIVLDGPVGGLALIDIGDTSNPTDLRIRSPSDNYFQAGPNGIFAANLRVGGTHAGVAGAFQLEVSGSAAVSNSIIVTNMTGFLNADQTTISTTFANANAGMAAVTVTSGHRYRFTMTLLCGDSTAADGAKVDFNGGSATATNFRVHGQLINDTGGATALAAAASTTLAGVINATAMTTVNQHEFRFDGSFEPSGTGTFIPRFAQNAHSTGTLTIFRGSNLILTETP